MRPGRVPWRGAAGLPRRAVGRGRRPGARKCGLDALSPERRAEYDKRLAEIDAKFPAAGRANVKDFVNHIDYAVKLIGIDHVGISSDFDGGGGIDGWNSAAEAFNVTLELVRRGYTEEQIGKLWSGNLLRVWGEVEKVSQKLRKWMMNHILSFLRDEQGQDLIEYTLLTAFLALITAALFIGAGGSIKGIWVVSNNQLAQANSLAS
jgi:Flp pilus assembly pilin Flp